MDEYESLSQTKWECKYHVVIIPKCRRKTLYEVCESIRVRCSGDWPSKRRAGSRKGI
jgi:hypothetical protein